MKIVNITEFERILKNKHGKIGDDGRTTVADLFITGGCFDMTGYSFDEYRFIGCCFESVRFEGLPFADFADSIFYDCLFVYCQFAPEVVFNNSYLTRTDFLKCSFYDGATFLGAIASNRKMLHDCDFTGGNLFLNEARWNVEFPPIVPETGAFEAWKACYVYQRGEYAEYAYPAIVHLRIPEDAERVSSYGRKCRASKAEVLGIEVVLTEDGYRKFVSVEPDVFGISYFDNQPHYRVGKTVTPENKFDNLRSHECASGIHFFTTKDEALKYGYEQFIFKFGWWARGVSKQTFFI